MKIRELKKYKKILILGYGLEGQATEKFLHQHHPSAHILIADQKDGSDYLERQDEADLVIKTPGISPQLVTQKYTTSTNIFFANVDRSKIIGITGTKGKSTTAALTHHILKTAGKPSYLAGNIGKPMIELLDQNLTRDDIAVLEMSSYQLIDIQYSPHICVLLNIYKELHNHESFESYKQAKFTIIKYVKPEDYYIYNQQYREFGLINTNAQKIPFKKLPDNFNNGHLIGNHNKQNIQAAFTIASVFDISYRAVQQAVLSFKPLNHRMQSVGHYSGITFIDDSAATHPSATVSAIKSYDDIGTLILGGQDRGYEIDELVQAVVHKNIENLVLFPEMANRIIKMMEQYNDYKPHILQTSNVQDAVSFAYRRTRRGQMCLFSPGFPSYISFKNFSERGEKFVYYVINHEQKEKNTSS